MRTFCWDIHSYSYPLRRHPIYNISNCFLNLFFDAIQMTLGLCPGLSCAYSHASRIANEGRTDHSWVVNDLRGARNLLQTETAGRLVRTGLLESADLQWIEQSAAFASGASCLPQW